MSIDPPPLLHDLLPPIPPPYTVEGLNGFFQSVETQADPEQRNTMLLEFLVRPPCPIEFIQEDAFARSDPQLIGRLCGVIAFLPMEAQQVLIPRIMTPQVVGLVAAHGNDQDVHRLAQAVAVLPDGQRDEVQTALFSPAGTWLRRVQGFDPENGAKSLRNFLNLPGMCSFIARRDNPLLMGLVLESMHLLPPEEHARYVDQLFTPQSVATMRENGGPHWIGLMARACNGLPDLPRAQTLEALLTVPMLDRRADSTSRADAMTHLLATDSDVLLMAHTHVFDHFVAAGHCVAQWPDATRRAHLETVLYQKLDGWLDAVEEPEWSDDRNLEIVKLLEVPGVCEFMARQDRPELMVQACQLLSYLPEDNDPHSARSEIARRLVTPDAVRKVAALGIDSDICCVAAAACGLQRDAQVAVQQALLTDGLLERVGKFSITSLEDNEDFHLAARAVARLPDAQRERAAGRLFEHIDTRLDAMLSRVREQPLATFEQTGQAFVYLHSSIIDELARTGRFDQMFKAVELATWLYPDVGHRLEDPSGMERFVAGLSACPDRAARMEALRGRSHLDPGAAQWLETLSQQMDATSAPDMPQYQALLRSSSMDSQRSTPSRHDPSAAP